MKDFENKVALITGGARGIGRSTALKFAEKGAKIAICDILETEAQETIKQVKAIGGDVIFQKTDVGNTDQVQAFINKTVKTFGRIDFNINNAGHPGFVAKVADQEESKFDMVINTNLKGVFLGMKYAIPHILKNGGVIVNIASGGGLVGVDGASVYCASKHGVVGMTKVAALDYAKEGIRVNAICPGGVDTPMLQSFFDSIEDPEARKEARKGFEATHPMGRIATAEEVADLVVFLCTKGAGFITGQTVGVDGGYVTH